MSESGRARLIAGAVMAAFAGVHVLAAPSRTGGPVAAAAAAVLVLGVLAAALARLARPRGPRTAATAAAQAALAYGAVACGASAGLLGFPTGTLLLSRGRALAVPVVATGAAIEAARGGAPADAAITIGLMGLVVYGLVRLAERVDDTAAARLPLTMAAIERERLRIAAELNRGLGEGLAAVTEGSRRALDRPAEIDAVLPVARRALNDARAAAADFRSMSLAPEAAAARALLEAAGVRTDVRSGHREPLGPAGALLALVLREAVTDVVREGRAEHCAIETSEDGGLVRLRVTNDGVRTAAQGAKALAPAAERVRSAGGAFAAGLAADGRFTVDAAVPAGERPVALPDRTAYRMSVTLLATVVAAFVGKLLLQLSGEAAAWPGPVATFGLGVTGLLAGVLLVALPLRAAVLPVAAAMAAAGAAAHLLGHGAAAAGNAAVSTLVSGLVVYGLVKLARSVRDLRAAGEELARAATVQERLRAARDLHDLLGHTLAAILLKCELVRRLAAADPARARAELAEVVDMAARARADLAAAAGGAAGLTLDGEVRSARSVLGAAGVDVETDLRHPELDAAASAVLGTVLREAVTNVLRHSGAGRCAIATAGDGATVRLTVENDGLDPRAPRTPPGSGLGNLATRLASHQGTLSARADGEGRFRLEATITSPA
ncbi:sensor histidine kinase [Actinomadura rifamycini]|uniref:sensor histidine kinase n=1 Tax=Actinomadura rifamycini TaxID=31962 RepID=UPI0004202AD5|nr:histidine kinase [Actinomadura rifamycini]